MRRLITVCLTACLMVGLPLRGPDGGAYAADSIVRGEAPEISAQNGALLLGGHTITRGELSAMEIFYVPAADVRYVDTAACDTDDTSLLPPMLASAFVNTPNDLNADAAIFLNATNTNIKPAPGDTLYIRYAAAGAVPASEWTALTIKADQLGREQAQSASELPGVAIACDSAVLTPANPYTRYEYAVVTAGETDPVWRSAGSAYEAGGKDITLRFPASMSPHTLWVRVADDDAPGAPVSKTEGDTVDAPYVNYFDESIGPLNGGANGTVWFINTNGGKKWNQITVSAGQEVTYSLAKVFGKKEAPIELRRYELPPENSTAAAPSDPSQGIAAAPVPSAENAVNVLRVTAQPRAELPKELKVSGFVSDDKPENWTLEGSAEFRTLECSSVKGMWRNFDLTVGLPLLTAAQQKAKTKPAKYQVRVPANPRTNTPASKTKNFSQQKQTKNPSFKPNFKTETVKIKAETFYCFAEPGLSPFSLKYKQPDDPQLSISEALTKGRTLYLYTPENGKKSRSGYQIIRFPERATAPDEGQGLLFVPDKGKVMLEKGYEYFGEKEKWGAFKKGETTGLVRAKATAKYNAKSGLTSGLAASRPVKAAISYDETGKRALSASVEAKKSLTLESWGLFLLNGLEAYDSGQGLNAAPLVAPRGKNSLCDIFFIPAFSEEANALMKDFTVAKNDEIQPLFTSEGYFRINGLQIGDIVTITANPIDTDSCRQSVYTLTVIPPLMNAPSNAGILDGAEDSGKLFVQLDKALTQGQTRDIAVELYEADKTEPFYTGRQTVSHTTQNTTRFAFDCAKEISTKGPGTYTLKAYVDQADGYSKSNPLTRTIRLTNEMFTPQNVTFTESLNLKLGETIGAKEVKDRFGNVLTSALSYQWYRVTPDGKRTLITENGSSATYKPVLEDIGLRLELLITNAYGAYSALMPGFVSLT